MVTNNLRDLPSDREAGKITLPVRLGDARTRTLYTVCALGPFVLLIPVAFTQWPVVLVLIALLLAVAPVRTVLSGARGKDLIPVLGATGRLELVFALLLLVGLVI
jgi:1,4-dihydroxy-2-naphthoate octaprenyltransferase